MGSEGAAGSDVGVGRGTVVGAGGALMENPGVGGGVGGDEGASGAAEVPPVGDADGVAAAVGGWA